ncbi:MAG: transposase, partial [Candidatus Paceibacterota bacterium]
LPQLVRVLAYTIMPNHFHFLLRQEKEGGIQTFMQKLSNSFSHYYNTVNNSRGPVFEGTFEAVRIETEKQLLHVSRYIHLNAVTAHLVDEPRNYEFSSYGLYVSQERANKNSWIDTSIIMSYFKTSKHHQKFVIDNKDYQRRLHEIKHLIGS